MSESRPKYELCHQFWKMKLPRSDCPQGTKKYSEYVHPLYIDARWWNNSILGWSNGLCGRREKGTVFLMEYWVNYANKLPSFEIFSSGFYERIWPISIRFMLWEILMLLIWRIRHSKRWVTLCDYCDGGMVREQNYSSCVKNAVIGLEIAWEPTGNHVPLPSRP
jgi:hypothetical protein